MTWTLDIYTIFEFPALFWFLFICQFVISRTFWLINKRQKGREIQTSQITISYIICALSKSNFFYLTGWHNWWWFGGQTDLRTSQKSHWHVISPVQKSTIFTTISIRKSRLCLGETTDHRKRWLWISRRIRVVRWRWCNDIKPKTTKTKAKTKSNRFGFQFPCGFSAEG